MGGWDSAQTLVEQECAAFGASGETVDNLTTLLHDALAPPDGGGVDAVRPDLIGEAFLLHVIEHSRRPALTTEAITWARLHTRWFAGCSDRDPHGAGSCVGRSIASQCGLAGSSGSPHRRSVRSDGDRRRTTRPNAGAARTRRRNDAAYCYGLDAANHQRPGPRPVPCSVGQQPGRPAERSRPARGGASDGAEGGSAVS